MDTAIFFAVLLPILSILFLLTRGRRKSTKKQPPGSLGIPIIGQSIQFLRAMRSNTAEKWLEDRIRRYGPISKLNLFGTPTVFVNGPAANKFLLTSDSHTLSNQQPQSIQRILGYDNLLELSGDDHRRVRGAIVSFLKPEVLKKYVGKMDSEVKHHIETHWRNKQNVAVLPLMKNLTFDIICSLLFGMDRGPRRTKMIDGFQCMIEGMWSIPINLPFTRFHRSLRASTRVHSMVRELIQEKRLALKKGQVSPHQDLITCIISNGGNKGNEGVINQGEIEDNAIIVMIAGHDTSSVLITFFMRLLANDPIVYAKVVHEQEEIAKSKAPEDPLTWEDVAKMKYTWKAAMETLRMIPPVFGAFRRVLKDIEYGGYLIPKGWQLFWSMSSTHMDEHIFADPKKFDPARFDSQASIPPYSFVPFGGGIRICPGNEFARLETLIAIHYLVTQFGWKLCCKDDTFIRDPMPVPSQGLPIQLEPK
ncbi:cytochrome P450 716B1-like protein [Cinnamomum micranthum f. kanehirae]|uniref:Cytochrome P450 716B1-like protein n=1 Tax=Cinnamomum micranthum f. kanehirae TaxID=337451 RepID=A0A443PRL8_9MAGN|nr:cytochrome P450 716B1-like protein [Cinnamomum micranthum f. kanehirae]